MTHKTSRKVTFDQLKCLAVMHSPTVWKKPNSTLAKTYFGLVLLQWNLSTSQLLSWSGSYLFNKIFKIKMWGHLSDSWNSTEVGSMIPIEAANLQQNIYMRKDRLCNGLLKVLNFFGRQLSRNRSLNEVKECHEEEQLNHFQNCVKNYFYFCFFRPNPAFLLLTFVIQLSQSAMD